jgi:hypothetical protein
MEVEHAVMEMLVFVVPIRKVSSRMGKKIGINPAAM